MSLPSIGVVIATPGRLSLLNTLNSILYQGLQEGDDVLIVGDGHHQPTADLVATFGEPFHYVATRKTRDWGHSQQNYGLKHIGGDWLLLQDDDDIFLPRAFDEARSIASKLETPRPVIGRVMTPHLGILWKEPGVEPLDGHCLLVPNDKKRLGYFGSEYAGDQKWLSSNLEQYDTYSWADRIWTLTRPRMSIWPSLLSHTIDKCAWRIEDGVGGTNLGVLTMERKPNDVWHAAFLSEPNTTVDYMKEVAEFAAWAGQGSDVWFEMHTYNEALSNALLATGYQIHELRHDYRDYTFTWPPHKFVPPENMETND